MKASTKVKGEVTKLLKSMWQAYGKKDPTQVLSFLIPDANLVLLGSGEDEQYVGPKRVARGLKRDFSQIDKVTVKMNKPLISAAGSVAWVVSGLQFQAKTGKQTIVMKGRFTAILEKRRGKWLLAHSHFSMPYCGQEEGESFAGNK